MHIYQMRRFQMSEQQTRIYLCNRSCLLPTTIEMISPPDNLGHRGGFMMPLALITLHYVSVPLGRLLNRVSGIQDIRDFTCR